LENKSGRAIFNSKITISGGDKLHLINPSEINAGILLPFAKNSYDLKLRSDSLLDNSTENLNVKYTGVSEDQKFSQEFKKSVLVKPFFSFEIPQLILIILFVITLFSWSHPFLPRKIHNSI
jgi:hypothetical protein